MKKVISLFARDYEGNRLVKDEVVPGAEWVVNQLPSGYPLSGIKMRLTLLAPNMHRTYSCTPVERAEELKHLSSRFIDDFYRYLDEEHRKGE